MKTNTLKFHSGLAVSGTSAAGASGVAAATAGAAVEGAITGAVAGVTSSATNNAIARGSNWWKFNRSFLRDLESGFWGGLGGAVLGAAIGAARCGFSDAYQWQTHKTVLEYGEAKANPPLDFGDFRYRVKMAKYVQAIEGSSNPIYFENLGQGTLAHTNKNIIMDWNTGLTESGSFSAERFYSSIVHENGHLSDKFGNLKDSYFKSQFVQGEKKVQYNARHEHSATMYEKQHRFYNLWSNSTQEWIKARELFYSGY